ncbi:MAG TPA: tRNA (adenosine(37)-N6)-threonylcarbamoyltransferase complex dimerization subunit type 1 TsaB [Candidatus Acidoferrum sp.]|nr:tRNA (adenosine(37)-N6)-threonylcarbamoyltransferase complex dimerization subunit type 1 TsaB [Candidatus Acidoferrum sp.]
MVVLGLDSTGKSASVALVRDGAVTAEKFQNSGYTHSETLAPMLDELLRETGTTAGQIDLIAVTAGPGSFTGIRIGLATVKGFAFAHDTPCQAISTLSCLAYPLKDFDGIVCPALDARRGQIYNALFQGGQRITPERAIAAADLAGLAGPVCLTGDGAELCQPYLPHALLAPPEYRLQRAVFAALSADMTHAVSPDMLRPSYLRLSQAEREKNAKEM